MDNPFTFSRSVSGRNFICRKDDCRNLGNLIRGGENVCLSAPPKSGKHSLLKQTFLDMKGGGMQFDVISVSLLSSRNASEVILAICNAVFKAAGCSTDDFDRLCRDFLPGGHFTFDISEYEKNGSVASLLWEYDDNDLRDILCLPYRVGEQLGHRIILLLDEFQNIMHCEGWEKICKTLEEIFSSLDEEKKRFGNYIFCGSEVNAMKEIFRHRHFFFRQVEHFDLSEPDIKELTDHMIKGFLSGGKVVSRELMESSCRLLGLNMYYINRFCFICNALSPGYIMEDTMKNALEILVSGHEAAFTHTMNTLTSYQINLLRAICEGNRQFSSSEVIRRYGLNSSANVVRLKDALCKKEIVTFDENDDPHILDPLFNYWVRRYYFNMG